MPSQTPPRCTINNLPTEILEQVFSYFCTHCVRRSFYTHCLRPGVIETAAEEEEEAKICRRTLSNACRVSRAFRPTVQRLLFHTFHDDYMVCEGEPTPADLFGRSLVARPDLRRHVRHLGLRGHPDKKPGRLSVQSRRLVLSLAHRATSVELDMGAFTLGALSKTGDPDVDDAPFFANTERLHLETRPEGLRKPYEDVDLRDLPASCEWSSLRHLTVYSPAPTLTPRMDMFAGLETLRFVDVLLTTAQLRIAVQACPRLTEFWYIKRRDWDHHLNAPNPDFASMDDTCRVLKPVKSLRVAYLTFPHERLPASLATLTQLHVLRLSTMREFSRPFVYLPPTLRELQLEASVEKYSADKFTADLTLCYDDLWGALGSACLLKKVQVVLSGWDPHLGLEGSWSRLYSVDKYIGAIMAYPDVWAKGRCFEIGFGRWTEHGVPEILNDCLV